MSPLSFPKKIPDTFSPSAAKPRHGDGINLMQGSIDTQTGKIHEGGSSGDAQDGPIIAASPAGDLMATVGESKLILSKIFRGLNLPFNKGQPVRVVNEKNNITAMRFMSVKNTTLLAAGFTDGSVKVYSPNGHVVQSFESMHKGAVTGIAFSPDGTVMISIGADGSVKLVTKDRQFFSLAK
jgi:WD40 repeat protein